MDKYYRHFRGGMYRLVGIAKDSEMLEEMVVNQAMFGDRQMWARPMVKLFEEDESGGESVRPFQGNRHFTELLERG